MIISVQFFVLAEEDHRTHQERMMGVEEIVPSQAVLQGTHVLRM